MKKIPIFLLLCSTICLSPCAVEAMVVESSATDVFRGDCSNPQEFRRTYLQRECSSRQFRSTVRHKKRGPVKSGEVVIHQEELAQHLNQGQNRLSQVIYADNGPITMDIKGFGEEAQTWDMPDFNNFPVTSIQVDQVSVASSGFQDAYPNLTHAFYVPNLDRYEMYELNQDELFFYGYGSFNENNEPVTEDYYLTTSPLPLEYGLEFEGTVTFIYEDDPELDSLQFIQTYYAIGQGTLNTYDEGPVDAVKLYFVEEITEFKDGEIIYYDYYEEIVWYSEEGHYIRAGLSEDAPIEGITSFQYMEYQKIGSAVLPVTWKNFYGELTEQEIVELHWQTATEQNNSHFLVQRSSDGIHFTSIGQVQAGNQPLSTQKYTFQDPATLPGTNYYRLQQVDLDGQKDYSEIVSVLIAYDEKENATLVLYPNPGKNEVWFSQAADFELFDQQGRLLTSGHADGSVNVSDLPSGKYLVRVNGGAIHQWLKQ